jgi:hypothetical protein
VPGLIDATSNEGVVPAGVCENIGVAATAMPNTMNPNDLIVALLRHPVSRGFGGMANLLD